MIHPLSVGSIPIYWGSSIVTEDFNRRAFINVDNYDSLDDLVEHIREVDSNQSLYEQYINEPIFEKNEIPACISPRNVLKYIEEKVLC